MTQQEDKMITTWEYTTHIFKVGEEGIIVRPKLDQAEYEVVLNRYGTQGWELISVFDVNMLQGASKQVVATFKRPRPAGEPPPLPA